MEKRDKFDTRSKQKIRKMIELTEKTGYEYFTIIKRDFSLGEITKGGKKECYPDELIKANAGNVIGDFHTHPNKTENIDEILRGSESTLNEFAKIMNIQDNEKEKLREMIPKHIPYVSMGMSRDDLRFTISREFTVVCIGMMDRGNVPRAICYEIYSDAKDRILKEANSLNGNLKEGFKKTWNRWINDEEPKHEVDRLLDSAILFIMYDWIIKEKYEISL